MVFPTKKQWKSWSLPSKHTALSLAVGLVALIFSVFVYISQSMGGGSERVQITDSIAVKKNIQIPIAIENELNIEVQIDPKMEFLLIKPDGSTNENVVEGGYVRIRRPEKITTINGRYPISSYNKIVTSFDLPNNATINRALEEGGYKLRVVIKNMWVHSYSESTDVIFDLSTINDGIRVVFYKENSS